MNLNNEYKDEDIFNLNVQPTVVNLSDKIEFNSILTKFRTGLEDVLDELSYDFEAEMDGLDDFMYDVKQSILDSSKIVEVSIVEFENFKYELLESLMQLNNNVQSVLNNLEQNLYSKKNELLEDLELV